MKYFIPSKNHLTHSVRAAAHAAVLAVIFTLPLALRANAEPESPPRVPANIQVPPGNEAYLVAHAVGTQNYVCRRSGDDIKFVLFTPEARLVKGDEQLTSHYFSPNPFEANTDANVLSDHLIRPTWRHSRDTSTVWAKAVANAASSAAPNVIPWLLLEVAGAQKGPNGGDALTATSFIQRVNTSGGMAPSRGCASATDIGNQAFVPYTADYVFFKKASAGDRSTEASSIR